MCFNLCTIGIHLWPKSTLSVTPPTSEPTKLPTKNLWILFFQRVMWWKGPKNSHHSIPIGSMSGIFTYIYHKNQLNAGRYAIPWLGILIPLILDREKKELGVKSTNVNSLRNLSPCWERNWCSKAKATWVNSSTLPFQRSNSTTSLFWQRVSGIFQNHQVDLTKGIGKIHIMELIYICSQK